MANEKFSSRLGMMLAMLGMAVGTGNIWRFPRIAAKNGGGEFLVAWAVFLFLWSIPLILLEFGLGRKTRSGPVRAFVKLLGPKWAWMGAFAVLVTAMIGFYYSVVAGWTLRYAAASLSGEIPEAVPGTFWKSFTGSAWPLLTHALVLSAAVFVVWRGVKTIERVALILMPSLIVLILVLLVRALFLEGAGEGLRYLFTIDFEKLAEPKIWIEALTQNAWDTGAGWGLVLVYAAYLREKEDTVLNAFLLPMGNNLISLIAAVLVFSTVFSVVPELVATLEPEALASLDPKLAEGVAAGRSVDAALLEETIFSAGNTGITFIWMPQLFARLPGGTFFLLVFFAALSVAAFTSLVAMVEVASKALQDAGLERGKATSLVGVLAIALGTPSALSLAILNNQDWVWGCALMLTGLFFALAVRRYGPRRFREEELNHPDSDLRLGAWWDWVIAWLVPLEAAFLFVWFLVDAGRSNPEGWYLPFDPDNVFNVGTVLVQVGLAIAVLWFLNGWIARRSQGGEGES